MKRILLIATIFVMSATWSHATINKQLTQDTAINVLKSVKNKCESVSSSVTSMRQIIEDMLADELSNLEESDQTKFQALPTELQDIINAANDLKTKIETYYPEVN